MMFDLTSPRQVLAGNAYGECRGGGRIGMENVTSVVLQRVSDGWGEDVVAVCLAPAQFSCWSDGNRAQIERAATADPTSWAIAIEVADAALAGALPRRTADADSYFAISMRRAPDWARPPARRVFVDRWHSFWTVRPARHAPNASVQSTTGLNDAELARITGASS